ncbi:MAG: FAD-dependent protein, partial [Bacteroidota bacterium]
IQNMREAVIAAGGEVRFSTKLTDIRYDSTGVQAIQLNGDAWEEVDHLILATGHSARDIFELLHKREILIEAKPFALGVRVEHPQAIIDQIQYHVQGPRSEFLPAASYSLVQQVDQKGVYSFCMCPGGIICPAATAPGEIVVNGWSPSKRNSPYANSGMVVEVGLHEMTDPLNDPLAGVKFQQMVEQTTFDAGGGHQIAPAQRLYDFVKGKTSSSLPESSYIPGMNSVNMGEILPGFIHRRLQGGFKAFGKKMKGYLTNEAIVVATESRTSSPVRIPRERETFSHPQLPNLYPCAEGAGYAGGIMSAAIDGQKCVRAAVLA